MLNGGVSIPESAIDSKEDSPQIDELPLSSEKLFCQLEDLSDEIVQQIKQEIEQHQFPVIIGDDASGRLPAIIFHGLISRVNLRDGLEKPKTLFLAGSRLTNVAETKEKTDLIERYLSKIEISKSVDSKKEKILIVTDTIETGKSLLPLILTLGKLKIPYEIVTLSRIERYPKGMLEANLGSRIVEGEVEREYAPMIYGRNDLSGVNKEDANLFAQSTRQTPDQNYDKSVRASRERIASIADNLYERHFS